VLDRVEASLKQALRIAQSQGSDNSQADMVSMQASLLMSVVIGRWHRYARSGFKKLPSDGIDSSLRILLAA
jgi:TetR/AcrR family transcriptional regulator